MFIALSSPSSHKIVQKERKIKINYKMRCVYVGESVREINIIKKRMKDYRMPGLSKVCVTNKYVLLKIKKDLNLC